MANQCSQCGSLLGDGDVLCTNCGSAVDLSATQQVEAAPAIEHVIATPAAAQLPAPFDPAASSPAQHAVSQPAISSPMFSSGNDLNGIGGWLFLVAFGLAISPFFILHGVYADLLILYGDRYQPGLAVRPGLAGLVMFEAITNTTFLAAVVCLNVLLYQRRRAFPTAMVVYFVAQFVWVFADHLMVLRYNPRSDWTVVLRTIVATIVWIPYFTQSQRVQATFIND
jgi:hypothetical protein